MSYRIKRKESLTKAVRRLCRKRIEHALGCLKGMNAAEAIHCARKDIKKMRAVLRMVRIRIHRREFQRHVKLLRKAAAHLAGPRDAHAKLQMVVKLSAHFEREFAPSALRRIRIELNRRATAEMSRFRKEKGAAAASRLLRRSASRLQALKVSGSGWNALEPGVKRCQRAGRKAYRTVRNNASPENFHAWRKCVKDLWYYVRLLGRTWPDELDAVAKELKTLGEYLGDDHDLAVLSRDLEQWSARSPRLREFETLRGLIGVRQGELRAAALELGERFYSEKPSVFCDRLGGYWKIWRRSRPFRQS